MKCTDENCPIRRLCGEYVTDGKVVAHFERSGDPKYIQIRGKGSFWIQKGGKCYSFTHLQKEEEGS